MARKILEPQFTCHKCGDTLIGIESVASTDHDFLRSSKRNPIWVATCWGCYTEVEPW